MEGYANFEEKILLFKINFTNKIEELFCNTFKEIPFGVNSLYQLCYVANVIHTFPQLQYGTQHVKMTRINLSKVNLQNNIVLII